jgi:hypothetical protein
MQLYLSIRHLMNRMKWIYFFLLGIVTIAEAQNPDHDYVKNVKAVKFNIYGNPLAPPVWPLNSNEKLELNFDDIDGNIKNFSYTFELRNADWSPTMLGSFDYIQGFTQMRLTNYRISSIALTRYTHYQAVLPDRSASPSRSGNYLLKVFQDGDPNKLVFTRRFLVVQQKADIAAQIQQPFNGQFFRSHQKVQFTVNTSKLNLVNAMQQVKVYILQNDRWDNMISDMRPTFIKLGSLEYNTENSIFPGGREWRWLDIRSFRLQSDRVERATYGKQSTDIFVRPDANRTDQRFVYYRDNDGKFIPEVSENVNPYWQADFATVHFRFAPPGGRAFPDKDIFVFGELSNYGDDENAKMVFNEETGFYETSLFLKQGYYDYCYLAKNKDGSNPSLDYTEGNYWETENSYTLLVYYRPLGGRADELIGYNRLNSLTSRPGF